MPRKQQPAAARVRLIHWNADEAAERAAKLRAFGHVVEHGHLEAPSLRGIRDAPPDAFVIDLTRLPSHGREVGNGLRSFKATRHVPLVFVGGEAAKVERVRALLPDATFTTWDDVGADLARALARPPERPLVPKDRMAGYSGTPLPKKVGIKEATSAGLLGAPDDFERTLGTLPADVTIVREPRRPCDLVMLFTTSLRDLGRRLPKAMKLFGSSGRWIAWPKQASGVETDVREPDVRRIGLDAGLVDYKICAIDATWSGLKFTWKSRG